LITILGARAASFSASTTMEGASRAITSALTGPSTISHIFLSCFSGSAFSLAKRVGLVVTPSKTPSSFVFLISSIFAVSINNFICA